MPEANKRCPTDFNIHNLNKILQIFLVFLPNRFRFREDVTVIYGPERYKFAQFDHHFDLLKQTLGTKTFSDWF